MASMSTSTNTNTNPDPYTTIYVKDNELKKINIKPQNNENIQGISFCAILITIISELPFIVCDLYFSYNSISCQYNPTPIGFDLSTWLKVSGFSVLGYIGYAIILLILSIKYEWIKILISVTKYLVALFFLAWLIVGSVMFWKYLEPSGTCNSDISNYMWARLIICLLGVLGMFKSSDKKDK